MKVGDLICYNAAGQRSKTIGIYLGTQKVATPYYRQRSYIAVCKIFWLIFGEILPRALQTDQSTTGSYVAPTVPVKTKGLYCHEDYGCFEIIKKSS